ncbi:unnamed protein product [Rhizophagus irregularis]|nr:unnamed protein product [Rhizophagus irregularis]
MMKKIGNDEGSNDERNRKRIAVRCQGLCDLEHINYSINSPASFGGGKKEPEVCEELNGNKRLGEALKAERATSSTVKFIHRHYYKQPLSRASQRFQIYGNFWLLQIVKVMMRNFGIKVAQFGLSGAFSGDKLLLNFLLSESSREYKIFKKALLDFQFKRIRQIRRTDSIVVTNPDLVIETRKLYEVFTNCIKS